MQTSLPARATLGFLAGALAVLTFHQGMWALLHSLNLPDMAMPAPFPMRPIPPFQVPQTFNLCFWGGMYGVVFGAFWPAYRGVGWVAGLVTGLIASVIGIMIVPVIKGFPPGAGWHIANWARAFLINGTWGVGLGVIYPLIQRVKS